MPTRPRPQLKSLFDVFGSPASAIKPTFTVDAGGYYAPKRNTGVGAAAKQFGMALESFGAETAAFALKGLKAQKQEDLNKGARIFERNQYELLKKGNKAFAYAEKQGWIKSSDRADVIRGFRIRQGQMFAGSPQVKNVLAEGMNEKVEEWLEAGADKKEFNNNLNDVFNERLRGLYGALPDNHWARDIGFMGAVQKELNLQRDKWNLTYKTVLDKKNVLATSTIMSQLLDWDPHAAANFFFEGSTLPEGEHPDFDITNLSDTLGVPVPELARFRGHAPVDVLPADLDRRSRLFQYWGNWVNEQLVDTDAPQNLYNIPFLEDLLEKTDEWRAIEKNGARLDEGNVKAKYISLKKQIFDQIARARAYESSTHTKLEEDSEDLLKTLFFQLGGSSQTGEKGEIKYSTIDPKTGDIIEKKVASGAFNQKDLFEWYQYFTNSRLFIPGYEPTNTRGWKKDEKGNPIPGTGETTGGERLWFHPTDKQFFWDRSGNWVKSENFGKTNSFLPTLAQMRILENQVFSLGIIQQAAPAVRSFNAGVIRAAEEEGEHTREENIKKVTEPFFNKALLELTEKRHKSLGKGLTDEDIGLIVNKQWEAFDKEHPKSDLINEANFHELLYKKITTNSWLGAFKATDALSVGGKAMEASVIEDFENLGEDNVVPKYFGKSELKLRNMLREEFPQATETERRDIIKEIKKGENSSFSFINFIAPSARGTAWKKLMLETLFSEQPLLKQMLDAEHRAKNNGLGPLDPHQRSTVQLAFDQALNKFLSDEVTPILREIITESDWNVNAIDPTTMNRLFSEIRGEVIVTDKGGEPLYNSEQAGSLLRRFSELGKKDEAGNVKYDGWLDKLNREVLNRAN